MNGVSLCASLTAIAPWLVWRPQSSESPAGSLSRPGAYPYIPAMPTRKPPDPDETAQFERFKALARELGCDEDEDAFDRALGRIVQAAPVKHVPKKQKHPRRKMGP